MKIACIQNRRTRQSRNEKAYVEMCGCEVDLLAPVRIGKPLFLERIRAADGAEDVGLIKTTNVQKVSSWLEDGVAIGECVTTENSIYFLKR